ncbi:MAG TPA: hypothetical protein PKE61_02815, partial [Burkholderiaceae bacterium]|nr:hypothetical protein [Burkholderiaceae bacterium]
MKIVLIALLVLPLPVMAQYQCASDVGKIYSTRPCAPANQSNQAAKARLKRHERKSELQPLGRAPRKTSDEPEG